MPLIVEEAQVEDFADKKIVPGDRLAPDQPHYEIGCGYDLLRVPPLPCGTALSQRFPVSMDPIAPTQANQIFKQINSVEDVRKEISATMTADGLAWSAAAKYLDTLKFHEENTHLIFYKSVETTKQRLVTDRIEFSDVAKQRIADGNRMDFHATHGDSCVTGCQFGYYVLLVFEFHFDSATQNREFRANGNYSAGPLTLDTAFTQKLYQMQNKCRITLSIRYAGLKEVETPKLLEEVMVNGVPTLRPVDLLSYVNGLLAADNIAIEGVGAPIGNIYRSWAAIEQHPEDPRNVLINTVALLDRIQYAEQNLASALRVSNLLKTAIDRPGAYVIDREPIDVGRVDATAKALDSKIEKLRRQIEKVRQSPLDPVEFELVQAIPEREQPRRRDVQFTMTLDSPRGPVQVKEGKWAELPEEAYTFQLAIDRNGLEAYELHELAVEARLCVATRPNDQAYYICGEVRVNAELGYRGDVGPTGRACIIGLRLVLTGTRKDEFSIVYEGRFHSLGNEEYRGSAFDGGTLGTGNADAVNDPPRTASRYQLRALRVRIVPRAIMSVFD